MSVSDYAEIKALIREVIQQYLLNQYPWGLITRPLTPVAQAILAMVYVLSIAMLALSFIQIMTLVRYGVRSLRYARDVRHTVTSLGELPFVSILIPVKGESPLTIERSIRNMAQLDYPRDLLEVVFVSDDPEYYVNGLRRLVNDLSRRLGINIKVLHRGSSYGYKGGALNFGIRHARGDVIAVFDVDTVPPSNYLLSAVGMLLSGYDAVTAVWRGYYSVDNVFSRLIKFMYDVYNEVFIRGRFLSGGFPAISGNNLVIWRRVLESLNGFCTCTGEDLDLSIRLRARGYRVGLLDMDVYCEVPHNYQSLKRQFSRWLFNGIWNLRHNTPLLVKSRDVPTWEKVDGVLWMLQFPSISFAAISILMTVILSIMGVVIPPISVLLLEVMNAIAVVSLFVVLLVISRRMGYGVWNAIISMTRSALLTVVMSFPMLIYSMESLLTDEWEWVTTPKGPQARNRVALRDLIHELVPIPILIAVMAMLLINNQVITTIYVAGITALFIYGLRLVLPHNR